MTKRFKDFGSEQVFDTALLEPVMFRIDGQTFRCKPALPGATLLAFVSDADSGSGGRASGAIPRLFSVAMDEPEYERFQTFVTREDRIVPLELLAEISAWLVEVYTERPTQPSSGSSNGIEITAPPSVGAVSSMGSG